METSIIDRLRQIEIDLAEIRQKTAQFGVGVNTPYCELLDAGGLVMSAARKLNRLSGKDGSGL